MRSLLSRVLLVFPVVAALASPVAAQPQPQPPPYQPQPAPYQPQPTLTTQARSNVVAVPAYQPPPVVNVNGYAPTYGPYGNGSPYGNYLSGKADVINARANASVTYQQAALTQQEAIRSSYDTRRTIYNETIYERGGLMNSQQVAEQKQIDALRRARRDPAQTEIWAGDSLNSLFGDIKKAHDYGIRGPAIPLDPAVLKHINLTTGVTYRGIGVLKDGPKLQWPAVFRDSRFDDDRKKMDAMTAQAIEQAMKGTVDVGLISDASATIERLQVILKQMVKDVPPGPYMDGKHYLRDLDSSFTALQSPNASNYFNGKYSAQGATVYDLTSYMSQNGLKFAPAVSGDQPSYSSLYQSLLTYDLQMSQSVSR